MSNSQISLRTKYDIELNELFSHNFNEKIQQMRPRQHQHSSYQTEYKNMNKKIKEGYRTLAFDDPQNLGSYYVKYPENATYNKKPLNSDSIWNK
jgi:uncharacterized FlaG/YvyC family protein